MRLRQSDAIKYNHIAGSEILMLEKVMHSLVLLPVREW